MWKLLGAYGNYVRDLFRNTYGSLRQAEADLLLSIASFIVADITNYYLHGRSVASDLSWQTAYSSLLPSIYVFLTLFGFRFLFIAPFRLVRDKHALQERLRPKLSVLHKEGHYHPWFQVQRAPDQASHIFTPGHLYYFRVTLLNSGLEIIRNAQVRLSQIEPAVDDFNAIPCTLQFMNTFDDHADVPMSDPEHVDGIAVDVVSYFLGDDGLRALNVRHLLGGVRTSIPVRDCRLRLSVTSDNGGVTFSRWVRISFPESGAPKMELLTS